jgi:hypothetical protein
LIESKAAPWNQPVAQMYLLETIVFLYGKQGFIGEKKLEKLAALIARLDAASPLIQALSNIQVQ